MQAPIVSYQSKSAPYSVLTSLAYTQSALGGNFLPVKEGENSSLLTFRIYNNYNGAASVATMYNVRITTYDGVGAASHTATQSPVSQSWVRIYETGFGESNVAPGVFTAYIDQNTAIGKAGADSYTPFYGSDGSLNAWIRAGSDGNGVGFIEFVTYTEVPPQAGFATYAFALSIDYVWTS